MHMETRSIFFLHTLVWINTFLPSLAVVKPALQRSISHPAVHPSSREEGRVMRRIYSDRMDCGSDKHVFDPRIHKTTYRVGVHAIRGFDAAYQEYNLTFAEYLTATAGQRFDPPVEFEMVPTTFQGLFDAVYAEEIDFFYANPGIYSCIGVEHGAQPQATVVSRLEVRGRTYDLDVFGGVMFTQADNDEINTIYDLKDKVIGAGSIDMIMAGQLQFYEMEKAGMSYVMDPKQVVFTSNQNLVVDGVLSGEFDVGFVRTDQIERTTDEDGNPIDPDVFKIISPQVYILDNGKMFPFLHSTEIYPEWVVAGLDHISTDVAEEVQEALHSLQEYAEAGKSYAECLKNDHNGTDCLFKPSRCETTPDLADLALQAGLNGNLAGFRTPRSYFHVRTMHEAAGYIKRDDKGKWQCTRADTLYEGIDCPAGHYKISEKQFHQSCIDAGLPCKLGYECFCKPCIKAFEVDVYHQEDFDSSVEHKGCEKMSLCGSVQQTKTITFKVVDNKERDGAIVEVIVHKGQVSTPIEVYEVQDASYTYEFQWSSDELEVAILEISINGKQIPESPYRVQVVERQCDIDFPGHGMVASSNGNCVCGGNTFDIGGKCVTSTSIAVSASVFAALVVACGAYCLINYRNRMNDKMWQVNVDELHFDDPVEVIGQGSFGVVLLAEYRGTKVAIKRALKSTDKKHGSTKSVRDAQKSNSIEGSIPSDDCSTSLGASSDKSSSDDITHETHKSAHSDDHSHESIAAPSRKLSESLNLGFLAEDFGDKHKWDWLFPWSKQGGDYQARFKESILGESASVSRTTLSARLFPWCNAQVKKRDEFIQEMRVLSRLRHPCITTVMGAVVSHSYDPMLVMEYMEYGSLHDLLRNETMYLSGDIIMQISRDIAQGLRYLHSASPPILHGDLKARNILIDSRFRAKICDFGLSTKHTNLITGTPFWMAPEYLRGQSKFNETCDMYSMGIIFFEIYARKNPYEGEDFRTVLRGICNRRVNKRPTIPPTAPPKMVDLMKKCWSPDPFFRPPAKELDMTLMDMNPQDAEPLQEGQQFSSKTKTGDMMYELFPKHIADALKAGQKIEPETHDMVTVVFSEIVNFQDISRDITPMQISNMLDRLYMAFDKVARKHHIFKVETVGDAYMGVTNLEGNQDDTHVKHVAKFAIDMVNESGKILIDEENPCRGFVHIRVGFHSGPVVSNVIGSMNKRYGLFGDTVNTASRMESNSQEDRILCSERSYKLLKEQAPDLPIKKRGKINVKGKGEMTVYWIGDQLITSGKSILQQHLQGIDVKHVGFAVGDESISHIDEL